MALDAPKKITPVAPSEPLTTNESRAAVLPSPPNPDAAVAPSAPTAKAPARAKQPYLGIATAAIPSVLAEHLGLETNSAVVVRTVAPNSPADKAGIRVSDVIQSIDGKPVTCHDCICRAITPHQPGERIAIQLIQHGRTNTVHVTLAERDGEEVAANENCDPLNLPQQFLESMPKEQADRIRKAIEGNLQAFGRGIDEARIPETATDAMRSMQERVEKMMQSMNLENPLENLPLPRLQAQSSSTVRLMDGDGSVELSKKNGDKTVTLYDNNGNVQWTGPYNSEQDRQAVPADLRHRIERLNIQDSGENGLRLQMNPSAPKPTD